MYEDVCYKKPNLAEVVVRIDFVSPISALEKNIPERLAKDLSTDFPIAEPSDVIGRELQMRPDGLTMKETHAKQWNFFGKERDKQLTLTTTSVFVSYKKYTKYEDMKREFSSTVEAIARVYPNVQTRRFGLRYVNRIERGSGHNPLDWSDIIVPTLLGVKDFFGAPEQLIRLFHIAELNTGDINVLFQFGLPNPDYPALIKRPVFILDIDSYVQIAHDIYESLQYMDQAHEQIQKLFEASIKDKLREQMNA
jgi:uncharacterized protein (TIGR04255 family)